MFYDTLGKFTDRNVEKFTEVPKSDDFGPNTGEEFLLISDPI